MAPKREHWGTRLGVILAVAGSAVGLGNFLRFPSLVAQNGGGVFIIPYLVAFLLLGIPLVWVEWSLGRMGGARGHGTAPAIFDSLGKTRWAKYFGVIGILGPFIILIYYMYIESWTLAFAFYSFSGKLFTAGTQEGVQSFLSGYQGLAKNEYFSSLVPAYIFFVVTFLINFFFIFRGIKGGIEKLSRIGMPILLLIAVFLVVRIFTIDTSDTGRSIWQALGFVWNPDFSKLFSAKVWLSAAGQIFFTLSVGIGVILTYASYLKPKDDIALSGLSAAATNEFCEVILGASIVIPAAFIFFGGDGAMRIANSGMFNIGFVSMPLIFGKLNFGAIISGLWFILLFIAGVTSSVSLIQPAVAFLEDEFKLSRGKSTVTLGVISFIACQPAIFFLGKGVVDELDFWAGTFFIVIFATMEILLFVWGYGIKKGWDDLKEGSLIRIPKIYKYIIKYITPAYLVIMLVVWTYQDFWKKIVMQGVSAADRPYIIGTRIFIFGLLILLMVCIRILWKKKNKKISVGGNK